MQPLAHDRYLALARGEAAVAEFAGRRFILVDWYLRLACGQPGQRQLRLFGPDETASNRLGEVVDTPGKAWMAEIDAVEVNLPADGRVMEILSEHLCEGWLGGYLLTGRHGLFACYDAFIHIIDSIFNQHAKWLKVCRQIPWRQPIASLNVLLTSHVWQQDHNGFSHQDPGFVDVVANKKADVVRICLAPDANCLLSFTDQGLRSRNWVNLIIAGKAPALQWLDIESAARHCAVGAGIWAWASNDAGADSSEPDVVMACAGDVPTLETRYNARAALGHHHDLDDHSGVGSNEHVSVASLHPVVALWRRTDAV